MRPNSLWLPVLLLAGCDAASVGNRTQHGGDGKMIGSQAPDNVSEVVEGVGAPMAWRVVQGAAYYGAAGQPPVFALRCDRGQRQIVFDRPGSGTTMLLSAGGVDAGLGTRAVAGGRVQARAGLGDAVLEGMSRPQAQITVMGGGDALTIPGGVAIRRVVESCRTPPAPDPSAVAAEPPLVGNAVAPPPVVVPPPVAAPTP